MVIPKLPNFTGSAQSKKAFHKVAQKFLKELATDVLKLSPEQFEVRKCLGGPAVCGESILHTDTLYVQVSDKIMHDRTVMWRECNGRKDYCGKTNNFGNLENLVAHCKRIAG